MRTLGKNSGRRRGFSFIEVMLSVFMVACLAGVVAAAMPVATLSRSKAETGNRATALAQKEMESVRGLGYANLTPSALSTNNLIDSTTADAIGALPFSHVDDAINDSASTLLPSGTGTVLIEQVDTELRRVTIRIGWTEREKARSYVLSTLVANL